MTMYFFSKRKVSRSFFNVLFEMKTLIGRIYYMNSTEKENVFRNSRLNA